MERTSQFEILDAQIRDCFTRVVWTQKTHEKCCDLLIARLNYLRTVQIALSVLITSGILYTVFGYNQSIVITTTVFSVGLFGLNIYVRNKNFGVVSEKHAQAAKELWSIRECYLSLISDIAMERISLKAAIEVRDRLQENLGTIYKGSPRTFAKGYEEASKALKNDEELTVHDEESNSFLPSILKK